MKLRVLVDRGYSRVSHKKPRRKPAPGLAVLGSVFKCCRPLGQQMKAYHSVMPAAVTRRPLADMKKGAGPTPTVRNEEAPEIVLSTGASSVTRLAIRARLVGLWAVGAYLRSKFGDAGKVPKRSPGRVRHRRGFQVEMLEVSQRRKILLWIVT